jgi:hypothetical protein
MKLILKIPDGVDPVLAMEMTIDRMEALSDVGHSPAPGPSRFDLDFGIDHGLGWWKIEP